MNRIISNNFGINIPIFLTSFKKCNCNLFKNVADYESWRVNEDQKSLNITKIKLNLKNIFRPDFLVCQGLDLGSPNSQPRLNLTLALSRGKHWLKTSQILVQALVNDFFQPRMLYELIIFASSICHWFQSASFLFAVSGWKF